MASIDQRLSNDEERERIWDEQKAKARRLLNFARPIAPTIANAHKILAEDGDDFELPKTTKCGFKKCEACE
jgi:hypothetical protein